MMKVLSREGERDREMDGERDREIEGEREMDGESRGTYEDVRV